MREFILKLKSLYGMWLRQWEDDRQEKAGSFFSFIIRSTSLLAVYVVLDRSLMRITKLPPESYSGAFIYLEFLKETLLSWFSVILISMVLLAVMSGRRLLSSWSDLQFGGSLRWLIMLTAGGLAWAFSTYDFNLYFNYAHYVDRFLLLIFMVFIYWRPVFVIPFLTFLLPIIWQFNVLHGFPWAIPLLPVKILVLFSSVFLVSLLTKKFRTSDFIFLLGCLIAAHYWVSGFGKLSWFWLSKDQLHFLIPATYANGWLGFLDSETISSMANFLSNLNLPLRIFTLVVEVGCIFLFLRANVFRFFIVGWVTLHMGIFLYTGIFFWTWAIVELGLLFLFLKKNDLSDLPIYGSQYAIWAFVLILTGVYWCNPVKLAWIDVPVSYTYRFEAENENGKHFWITPNFFGPYEYTFTLGNFGYLDNEKPSIAMVWGAGPSELVDLNSKDEFFNYEKERGLIRYEKEKAEAFRKFLQRYVRNWNERRSKGAYLTVVQAPRFIWTYPAEIGFSGSKRIVRIKVYQVTSLYVDGTYEEIRNIPVMDLSIY
ncbi:MAG: hypothetical protein HKN25_16455 [Pyrinomonadaceae bacterium]|nr:hypothetical protein [Pyrinomonadaceae bacterium]